MKATRARLMHGAGLRSVLLGVLLGLGALALEARVIYLQLVHRQFLTQQGDDRHLRTIEVAAHRGNITDRNGEPLAVSAPVDSIWVNPQELKTAMDRLPELARYLERDEEWLARRITSNLDRGFVYLRRHLAPDQAAEILRLGLPGVGSVREYRRYYPAGEVTGHLLGFTDVDDQGQEGLELAFDGWLAGHNGSKRVIQDRLGRTIGDIELITAPRPGRSLRTSIDLGVQYVAYRELKRAVTESSARSGSVVVLDPASGEVLAVANQPSFNPNNRLQLDAAHYRNRAATDIFEPGSSFKPLIVAAALQSERYRPDSVIDTSPGFIRVGRSLIQDTSNLGRIDLTTLLAKSSNVGATRLALDLDPSSLWEMLAAFGIGRLTESGFPGESAGVLNEARHWRQVGQATLAYGYGLSVTTLQLARAYGVIAADGVRRPLSFLALEKPPEGERVLRAADAVDLRHMLEAVVADTGTGQRAAVPHYRVAGKTGTAKKAGVGGYIENRYTAVFAGLAPASAPRLVIIVVLDEPQGDAYYGGEIAAPVFARIASGALRLLNVAPDALGAQPTLRLVQAPVVP
jgi:cell division protein FtsI (penicillin-binding protein 3)